MTLPQGLILHATTADYYVSFRRQNTFAYAIVLDTEIYTA